MVDSGAVVVTRDLTVGYPGAARFDAVRGIDLRVEPGELVGIVGRDRRRQVDARARDRRPHRPDARRGQGPRVMGGSVSVLGHARRPPGPHRHPHPRRAGGLPAAARRPHADPRPHRRGERDRRRSSSATAASTAATRAPAPPS